MMPRQARLGNYQPCRSLVRVPGGAKLDKYSLGLIERLGDDMFIITLVVLISMTVFVICTCNKVMSHGSLVDFSLRCIFTSMTVEN